MKNEALDRPIKLEKVKFTGITLRQSQEKIIRQNNYTEIVANLDIILGLILIASLIATNNTDNLLVDGISASALAFGIANKI